MIFLQSVLFVSFIYPSLSFSSALHFSFLLSFSLPPLPSSVPLHTSLFLFPSFLPCTFPSTVPSFYCSIFLPSPLSCHHFHAFPFSTFHLLHSCSFQLPTLELPTVERPTLKLPTLELPTLELLTFQLSTFELPSLYLPTEPLHFLHECTIHNFRIQLLQFLLKSGILITSSLSCYAQLKAIGAPQQRFRFLKSHCVWMAWRVLAIPYLRMLLTQSHCCMFLQA